MDGSDRVDGVCVTATGRPGIGCAWRPARSNAAAHECLGRVSCQRQPAGGARADDKDNISEKERSLTGAIARVEGRPRVSVRLAVKLVGEMVKLPLRAGAVDRSVWPIAAPLARVAELLRFDLADVTEAAERVAPYITADGRRLWW